MKTLLVLLALGVIATATPTAFPKDGKIFKNSNKVTFENSQLHRQKKSPSLANEETSPLNNQNLEDQSVNTQLTEERHSGLKKPVIIRKKFGYHRLRDSGEERESKNDCESPVQVKVCNEESGTLPKKMRLTSASHSDTDMTEHEMENSIQMAKEAVENLHRDLLNIERNSQSLNTRSDSGLDSELHSNIEIARKALENIHQNFGEFEAMNLKDATNKDKLKATLSDVERFAQWKEAIQKNIETTRNIEDGLKPNDPTKDTSEKGDTVNKSQRSDVDTSETNDFVKELKSEKNDGENKFDKLSDHSNLMNKQRNDGENENVMEMLQSKTDNLNKSENKPLQTETKLKMSTDKEIETPALQASNDMVASEINRSEAENDGLLQQLDNIANSQNLKTRSDNNNEHFTMKSNDQNEALINMWAQEKSSDDGKQKLFDTLSMRLSENENKKPEMTKVSDTSNPKNNLQESNLMRMAENNFNNQEHMSFKMSPTNMIQQQNLNTHHSSHMPMLIHGHHMPKQFDTTDINFDQNNVNVFQNQDNSMVDMNQQQTAEDPFFMRWAAEQQRNNMGLHNSAMNLPTAHMNDLHNMEAMNQFQVAGNDEHSELGTNMHDHEHMHIMHHGNMDSSMQPSMRMNMMTNMGKPTLEYNSMQWANQALARSSYGSSPSPSAPSGDSGPGAVGIFPNAKVGGCAIPLLVSCSPSLATGSLAKAQPQPSYSAPGYRSGDSMVYYMKRDVKEDDIPVIKVQRTHTPFNHKTELLLEKTHE